jgi:hypothetical protein
LAVDLIVSALDATEDFDWNRISQWLNVVRTFVGLKPLPSKGIPRALSRVRDVAFQIAPIPESDARREFYLALAVEFLRSTYRIDISLPKRVLAYEAGELCFRLARGAGRVAGRGKA